MIMENDPYYWTQDNGAGGPVHFATTYKQIDMLHHVLRHCPAAVNQRDPRGYTPLHRAAYLAQYDGYLELYEYLLSEGADPTVKTEDYDPYLNPGRKLPVDVAIPDETVRGQILALERKYAKTPRRPEPHRDLGDWWALYDYGPETVAAWPKDFEPNYAEQRRNKRHEDEKKEWKKKRAEARRAAIEAERAREAAANGGVLPGNVAAMTLSDKDDDKISDATEPQQQQSSPTSASASASGPAAPSGPIAFLFPGQGSQAVGMLASPEVADLPSVRAMRETAREILGYDLHKICVEGPKETLDDTEFAQPALFLANLCAVEKLKAEDPAFVANCAACAGLSLGEYSALVYAGAMSFEDGMRVVKARAEAMKAAAAEGDHGMLSVVGLADDVLERCVEKAKAACATPDAVCAVANYLFPQGRVVSGDRAALDLVAKEATDAGAMKAAPVAVSGAFHTARMDGARAKLEEALGKVAIRAPAIPVYSNVTGEPMPNDPEKMKKLLAEQLTSPVRWEATMRNLLASGKDEMVELGPNKQIKSMAKRVSMDAWKKFKSVDVYEKK